MPTYSPESILDQQQRALQAAIHAFDQTPAPSLREVLGAYRLKGDGDREMLLAILNAKAAEDQVCIYILIILVISCNTHPLNAESRLDGFAAPDNTPSCTCQRSIPFTTPISHSYLR